MKTKNNMLLQLGLGSKLGKIADQIVVLLKKSGKPMTLSEIATELEKPPKSVFKGLRKLFNEEKIESDVKTRTYKLVKE